MKIPNGPGASPYYRQQAGDLWEPDIEVCRNCGIKTPWGDDYCAMCTPTAEEEEAGKEERTEREEREELELRDNAQRHADLRAELRRYQP